MSTSLRVPIIPAAFFGMVLGLAGLGNSWRAATVVWQQPAFVSEAICWLAVAVWAILILLYIAKWATARDGALKELSHPVQCCFIGLIGVATMLVAGCLLPYSRLAAEFLFAVGAAYTLLFAIWRTGGLWQGDRQEAATTPVLYLPAVAGSFVTATVSAAFGHPDWGQFFFGAGLFTWLSLESVLVHRLFVAPPMPPALRPTLGIQLAPAPVGAIAYIAVGYGPPDILAHALIGYGILQALILLRLLPWILEDGLTPAHWAFTFGATALAAAPLRLIARNDTGPISTLAPILFVAANIIVFLAAAGTIYLLVTRRMPVDWASIRARTPVQ
jgi:tellurite resistance protein